VTRFTTPILWLAAAALLAAASGCARDPRGTLLPNSLPEVELTAAPADPNRLYYYRYTLEWTAFDTDGGVEHFLYAVDPPAAGDTVWTTTRGHSLSLEFRASGTVPGPDSLTLAAESHTFVIAAVDDRRAIGPRVVRSFFSYTQAPTVRILSPKVSNLLPALVSPTVDISWIGDDPDGLRSHSPVRYKYLLLGPSAPIEDYTYRPDLLKQRYAPDFRAEDGWVEVGGEVTAVRLTHLNPGQTYLFVVVAFDEAGAFSPVFSLVHNVVRLRATYAANHGPRITLYNEFFNYTYPGAAWNPDQSAWIPLEVPVGVPITIRWSAETDAQMRGFRWSLDNENLLDDTPRRDEETDVTRWSAMSRTVTSATIGPFTGATQQHFFYVEAMDDLGLRSLGVVAINAVQGTFDRPLLIVDDTRLAPDAFASDGSLIRTVAPWPTAAELDTFLYARGGAPWRAMTAGTISQPGLFAGYDFDTLGTRTGLRDLSVPLARLGRYRHVVWLVDGRSATFYRNSGQHLSQPQTSLSYMNSSGHANTLGTYAAQGGHLWLAGGGAAAASLFPWNVTTNDSRSTITFSASRGELAPGRLMYEFPAWRSEIRSAAASYTIQRYTGRHEGTGAFATLPARIDVKTRASDPLARFAPGRSESQFYLSTLDLEFLQLPNEILDDSGAPGNPGPRSTLDTLYHADGTTLPNDETNPYNVVMTVQRPRGGGTVVFTGFDLWHFQRQQLIQLADFVLRDQWGLARSSTALARRAAPAPGVRRPAAPARR
jgi:hypothetical protein